MPGAKTEADFFLAFLQTFICPQPKQIFLICYLTQIYLLRLHFSWLVCKKYPAWLYRN